MSIKLLYRAASANGIIIRSLSTILRTKNVLNCGLNVVKHQYNLTIHGTTANQLMKEMDLTGKTCLITGANSGLGLEMTRCLTARGCAVLMACRNKYAAGQVARSVAAHAPDSVPPRFYEVNLASLRSVTDCCDRINKNENKIDIVILNAGVFGLPWTLTEDLLETTFQVNYLSQLYLLLKIETLLAPDARAVFITSESHRNVKWSLEDQSMPTESLVSLPCDQYTSIKAYNISKLCCLLAMHHTCYRWLKTNKSVFAAHPGTFVKTRLCRNWWPYELLYTVMQPFSKTVNQAVSTPLYCATSPDLEGLSGYYYKNLKRCEESELAKNFHLSFRLYDIYKEIIAERLGALEIQKPEDRIDTPATEPKVPVQETTMTPDYNA